MAFDEDYLWNLVFKFQSATAVPGKFNEETGEFEIEPFHPVVDVVMSLPSPDGEGDLSDWYDREMHKRLFDEDDSEQ